MNIADMLIQDEGLELKLYKCTGDKWTIGVGRNLETNGISESEARFMLMNDIQRCERGLMSSATFNAIDDVRQMAIINMAFQLGVNGCFAFRRMWAALDRKDWQAAHDEALNSRWAQQTPNRSRRIANVLLTGELDAYKV
jgi:lysozyme